MMFHLFGSTHVTLSSNNYIQIMKYLDYISFLYISYVDLQRNNLYIMQVHLKNILHIRIVKQDTSRCLHEMLSKI